MKQAESAFATGAIEVLGKIEGQNRFQCNGHQTYSGPGMTLAFLMSEYGMMMIGLVGNAKKG
jgi:hypothetical protein